MLQHLDITEQLRKLYSYPEHPEAAKMLPRLTAAYSSELSEVLGELKSLWAWWPGKPINREKLLEETADVLFFHMLFVLHARDYCHGFSVDGYREHFRAAANHSFGSFRQSDLKNQKHADLLHEFTVEHLLDYQADINKAPYTPYKTLYYTAYSFWTLVYMLDFSPQELERAFLKKFLTNIIRTGQQATAEGTALYEQVQKLLAELEVSAAAHAAQRINNQTIYAQSLDPQRMVA